MRIDSLRHAEIESVSLEDIYMEIIENKVELKQIFDVILKNHAGC